MLTPIFGPGMMLYIQEARERDLFAAAKRSRVQASAVGRAVTYLPKASRRHNETRALAGLAGMLAFWTHRG